MLRAALVVASTLAYASVAHAETVEVKFRGAVDLKPFTCQDITRSSFANRVCYDKSNEYMLVLLKATYYHYCQLPESTLNAFLNSPS